MSTFQASRVTKKYTHRISASPSEIFPLLCPVREYDWIDGWSSQMIYSRSGFAENGCVFRTSFPRGDEIWVVSRYEPDNYVIQFVVVNPESHIMKLEVALDDYRDNTTCLKWTHVFTGLTERGHSLIDRLSDELYLDMMGSLSVALEHYCSTGTMLKRSVFERLHAALHRSQGLTTATLGKPETEEEK